MTKIKPWSERGDEWKAAREAADSWGWRFDHGSASARDMAPAAAVAVAAMLMPDSPARRAVMSAVAAGSEPLDALAIAACAIKTDSPGVLADVQAAFGMDMRDWRWLAMASVFGSAQAVGWLLGQGAATHDGEGFAALGAIATSRQSRSGFGGVNWKPGHAAAVAALCSKEALANMPADARACVADALGERLLDLTEPRYKFEAMRGSDVEACSAGLAAVWGAMAPSERAACKAAGRAMMTAALDLDGLYGGKPRCSAALQERLVDRDKEDRRCEPGWPRAASAWAGLKEVALGEDWGAMEDACQARGWSLGSAAIWWAEKASDGWRGDNWSRADAQRAAKAFEATEALLGRPLSSSSGLLRKEGPGGKMWLLSKGAGSALVAWLGDSKIPAADVAEIVEGYGVLAGEWGAGRELPAKPDARGHEGDFKLTIKQRLLGDLNAELAALYRLCDGEVATGINRLANEWGCAEVDEANFRPAMAAWAEKIQMLAGAFGAGQGAPRVSGGRRANRI